MRRQRRSAVFIFPIVVMGLGLPVRAQDPCPAGAAKPWPADLIPPKDPRGSHADFETRLLNYMKTGAYRKLGWCVDKDIRATGPFVEGTNYGTHYNAVRLWYSPNVVQWLQNNQAGEIPNGAVIIKEQYGTPTGSVPPACYQYMTEQQRTSLPLLNDWSIMIKRTDASKDGWFWTEVWDGIKFPTIAYPNGGFGNYCLRCHASAQKDYTFSSLNNIAGFPGQYLTFYEDDYSWRSNPSCQPQSPPNTPVSLRAGLRQGQLLTEAIREPMTKQRLERLPSDHEKHHMEIELLHASASAPPFTPPPCNGLPGSIQCMVPETYDRSVSPADHPGGFVSSDQCLGCHSTNWTWMFLSIPNVSNTGINVSPYGEWRWSPMGLAGRDPIFYAQVESELAFAATVKDPAARKSFEDYIKNTCFHCHGVMGQREFYQDFPQQTFDPNFVNQPQNKYGALARDGISCTSCHRIKADYSSLKDFLDKATTGNFDLLPRDEIEGPFEDNHIVTVPMDQALGLKPKFNEYTTSSRLCGSCHVINLPVVDHPPIQPIGPGTHYDIEQNTYTEWLNSKFENEINKNNPNAKSCQDCHMPASYVSAQNKMNVQTLPTKIAVIEDQTYPAAEHRAALDKITVTYRETGFRRHELVGLNGFLLSMFNGYMVQDPTDNNYYNFILGVRQRDYMSGLTDDLNTAMANVVQQAQSITADVGLKIVSAQGQNLTADVTVTNKTGHRFPSGVGFRRAFIEFVVTDQNNKVVWTSGTTDPRGVILGPDGKALPTEFFDKGTDGLQQFQHHHDLQHPITTQTQVQIYEELIQDADHRFTTSFVRRDYHIKDNRVLPPGWKENAPIPQPYLKDTYPVGEAWTDPVYHNGQGMSIVRYQIQLPPGVDAAKARVSATLYDQSIPPYFLRQRYEGAPNGPATIRLRYLVDHLDLNGTPFQNWKLKITAAKVPPLP